MTGGRPPLSDYFRATRPPFLLASVVPVGLGIAAAAHDGHRIAVSAALLTLLGAILAHASTNVLNDYHDRETDAINEGRLFPYTGGSRMIQEGVLSPRQVRDFGLLLLFVCALCGVVLLYHAGPSLLLLGLVGMLLVWGYSAPPLSLNARGLGELGAAIGVGGLIPLGSYLVQAGNMAWTPLHAGLPYALLAANLLVVNQYPDRLSDAVSGKRHWIVRLGPQRGRWLYLAVALSAWLLLPVLVVLRYLPPAMLLGLPAALFSVLAVRELWRHAESPSRLTLAIRHTIAALLVGGGLLASTMWYAGMVA